MVGAVVGCVWTAAALRPRVRALGRALSSKSKALRRVLINADEAANDRPAHTQTEPASGRR